MDVQFVMFKEDGERRAFELAGEVTVIGRQDDCDIRIPLPEVSRRHAEVRQNGDAIRVKDLGSANGTYVNNKRVKEKGLAPGDHLVIGPVVFTVQIDGQPVDIRAVKTKLERQSVFTAEDDLTTGLTSEGSRTGDSAGSSADREALAALEASADGSSLAFELDEDLDLGEPLQQK